MRNAGRIAIWCAAAAMLMPAPVRAQDGAVAGFIPGAGLIRVPVVSLLGEHFFGIVRQHTDYSCGAASVATILRYAYGMPASENSVIRGMLQVSNPAVVRVRGFSLLDIKHYVNALGLIGAGYQVPLDKLFAVKVPTIALLDEDGYEHFVVLKKTTPTYTYVADPIRGNQTLRTSEFARMWNGIIFIIAAPSYQPSNVLVRVHAPPSLRRMADGIPPDTSVLANAVLSTIYIPGIDRL